MQDVAPRYWIMIATLGFVWGSTFLLIEVALQGITPIWLATSRITFAAILLTIIWGLRGFRLFESEKAYGGVVFAGVCSTTAPFIFVSWGQQYVTSAFTGVCMSAIVLIMLPMAHFFVPGETMTKRKTIGFAVGFAGLCLLFGPSAFASTGSNLENWGRLAIFTTTLCYASSSVVVRRMPAVDPLGLATVLILVGWIAILPLAFWIEGPPQIPNQQTLFVLLLLGLIPTAAANLLRVFVVRGAGPTFMSLTNYQVPIWAVIMGALVLGEPLPSTLFAALGLMLIGMVISQYGALTRLFRAQQ